MADVNDIVGSSGDDTLNAAPGANNIIGGAGNDTISVTDGVNTIQYQAGDGVDSIRFALPRTYQYARFLTEANKGLADFQAFITTANTGLINALPFDISSVLLDMRRGTATPAMADAARNQLIDWIGAPVSNVIQFGPGINLSDIAIQVGATASFGAQQGTPVQFAVALNNEEGMVFGLDGPQVVARDLGAAALPPTIDMTFQFADGTSATLADLLARPGVGAIGDQMGSEGSDFLHGTLGDDTLMGNGGDDKLDGGAGTDRLFGGDGDDVISGGSGDDFVFGEGGNDVLASGKNGGVASYMSGGVGDDVYCFNRGDGLVTIDDLDWTESGVDTLSFGNGVALSDVVASIDSMGNLMLGIAGTNDVITIPWFDAANGMTARADSAIERVQFFDADGTSHVYDLGSLVSAAFPDPATADPTVSVVLVDPGSTKGSLSEVGQPYARSYALTGNLFPLENNAPTAGQAIDHQSATQGVDFTFKVPANAFVDIDNDTLSYSAKLKDGSALPSWLTLNSATGEFSGTPSNADVVDLLNIEITASDGSASASQEFSLSVANVNDAPTAGAAIDPQSATQGVDFVFKVPANAFVDIDNDTLSYSAKLKDGSALPSWLTLNSATGEFSGTPSNADVVDLLNIEITASDGSASASQEFSLSVANVNDAPTAGAAIDPQSATQGVDFVFKVPANAFVDIDNDTLSYSAKLKDGSALPSWLTLNSTTGEFSGTPSNADVVDMLNIELTASDGSASASQEFSLSVANVNDAPTAGQAIDHQSATQGVDFTFKVPATAFVDIDNDTLSYSAKLKDGSALPSWLTLNSTTGEFSGTPSNADVVDMLNIELTASDGSASASQEFSLSVANVNDAPTVANPMVDQTATQGVAFAYTVPGNAFTDMDKGDVLTYTARLGNGAALPTWLQFDGGTFSGTPGGAGQWNIQLLATDTGGASVSDFFTLTAVAAPADPPPSEPPPTDPPPASGHTINGTKGNDRLYGTPGDDRINGGKGKDLLSGGAGDDALYESQDGKWASGSTRKNAFTGERVSIAGKQGSYDVFDGGTGYDVLMGTSGSDAILLDDSRSAHLQAGPRVVSVEKIDAGAGNDVIDLTSKRYTYGDVEIDGGSGNDVLWSSKGNDILRGGSGNDRLDAAAGNDYVEGGSGNDKLNGRAGVDLLQGGSGNDDLTDTSGNGLLDGGSGNDTLTEGSGNSMLVGGKGNDHLYLGGGYDIIAFNRGDGRDVVSSGKGGNATLSLGGGIRYQDLSLRRSGNDLILETGDNERITFEKWYAGKRYQAVSRLQVYPEAMPLDSSGGSAMLDDKVESFDFKGLVSAFDSARRQHPGLSRWTLTNALAQFQLGDGSDSKALGGDLAYQYGVNSTLAGIAVNAAQGTAASSQFGKEAQTLHSQSELKDGLVKLS